MTNSPLYLRFARVVALPAIVICALVSASAAPAASPSSPAGTNLAPVKSYLLQHTALLTGFARQFQATANRYYATAKVVGFDYDRLAMTKRAVVARELARAKALWIQGNPYYERVEGVVAGTPSLAVYDVILDAGSSAKEDPGETA